MNQHKKAWLLLFILTLLIACSSVTVFATDTASGGTEITPEQVQKIIDEQAAASSKLASKPTSSAVSEVSSKKSVSSKRTYSSAISSADSSEISSVDSSSMISSEEVSSEIVLPSVGSVQETDPLNSVIVDSAATKKANWIGVISWVCIALGVIVVLIVVFSNRRPPSGGSGRKRYRRPGRTHKKHLLNDKYYRNMKY